MHSSAFSKRYCWLGEEKGPVCKNHVLVPFNTNMQFYRTDALPVTQQTVSKSQLQNNIHLLDEHKKILYSKLVNTDFLTSKRILC